ncbi:MAG: Phage major coat protein Gp8 [Verrucomicrobiaceae bacterium]|nr:Phage major coat protein Gp8 [Verrucomicrobiaceae bacterium]
MKNVFKKIGFGIISAGTLVAASANAALPAEATAAITSASTTITDVSAAVWPAIGAGIVAFLTIKIIKKFANKIG